uniref:Amino acid transporter n=1 Tax=Acrobeloides nanus TaxID=290746 RepID=A0A914D424_9BILA
MIWNSSQAMTTIFALNAAELESMFPYAVFIITGPARYLANLGKPVEMALVTAFVFNAIAYTYVASVMFLYKYTQITENWLHPYITQHKYALPCNLLSETLGTIIVMVPALGYFDGSAAIKEALDDVIKKETDLEDATVIGFL